MYQNVKLVAFLLPYFAFAAAGAVLGTAFVSPPLVFGTVGEEGLVIAIAVTVGSLAIMFVTEDDFVTVGTELISDK